MSRKGRGNLPNLFESGPAQADRVGARLFHFRHVWAASIHDFWTIKTVSSGHAWTFTDPPRLRWVPTTLPASEEKRTILLAYIESLLAQGAVIPVPVSQQGMGMYSPLFLVQKKSGAWRPVIDLTHLNRFIKKERFKMETLSTIQQSVQPGDWMVSIDLKDAYFHVPIAENFQQFLRFSVGNLHLQFTCLPFGLSTSPRVFSKVLLAIVALLRTRGIRLHHYLDDLLLLAQDRVQLIAHRGQVISTLQEFGWILNQEKSQLDPSQSLVFLGALFDTVRGTISLPEEKISTFRDRIHPALSTPHLHALQCLRIIGTMVAAIPMVRWAQWRMRPFQKGFLHQWKGSKTQLIRITASMRHSLLWWLQRENLSNCHSILPIAWVTITTDASNRGWGAHCLAEVAQGTWEFPSRRIVSNILELRAAFQALLAFRHLIQGSSVLLRLDNTTAVAYIRRQGGTRSLSLLQEVEPIMSWAQKNLKDLTATYVPGVQNVQADFLSRRLLDNNEWSLHEEVFKWILSLGFLPEVDLFASPCNKKMARYYSRYRDPQAYGVDALTEKWWFNRAYAFPPTPIILQFLKRLRAETAEVLAIIPYWPNRPWFPLLTLLSVRDPIPLPSRPDLLSQGSRLHPCPDHLRLRAWLLKGEGWRR